MKYTKEQFKEYVLAESQRLFNLNLLEEKKIELDKEMDILKENLTMDILNDPAKLKEYRQKLQAKASGWANPSEMGILSEKKYSNAASNFIGDEISHLMHDKGYKHDRAVAAAINVAKDKGYKVPANKEESALEEKWDTKMHTPESKKGMFDDWTKAKLEAEQSKLREKPNHTAADTTKLKEINFALRAKNNFGKAK